jgi:hypothetical protein
LSRLTHWRRPPRPMNALRRAGSGSAPSSQCNRRSEQSPPVLGGSTGPPRNPIREGLPTIRPKPSDGHPKAVSEPSLPARPPPEQTDFLSLMRFKRRGSTKAQDRKLSRAPRENSCKASRRVTPRQVCNQPAAVLCSPSLALSRSVKPERCPRPGRSNRSSDRPFLRPL